MIPRAASPDTSLEAAFARIEAAPRDVAAKVAAARILERAAHSPAPEYAAQLHALLVDPDIDPRTIARHGWAILIRQARFSGDPEADARWLETNDLALDLLNETMVTVRAAEIALTRVRRWLLLSDSADALPRTVAALVRQAMHNGGAWLFDEEERASLAHPGASPMRLAYLPPRPQAAATPAFASPVTRAVAGQYDGWPYPAWQRAMAGVGKSFTALVADLGPDAPRDMPEGARFLVAGCGTGHEPVSWARRFPSLHITAIDISRTALDYGMARAAAAGVTNIRFELLDLHEVASLGVTFDCAISSGVLHHLPDPEAGWAAITSVLRPGGVMRIMLYSTLARLIVRGCQAHIADLARQPIDDDLLRRVRARLWDLPVNPMLASGDFHHLGGIYDLFLHQHEDPFDVDRIRRAIEMLGLELLRFRLPSSRHRAAYRAAWPGDPHFRDFAAWEAFERTEPSMFAGMYDFWCVKP